MRSERAFLRQWFKRFPKNLEVALYGKQQCEAYSFLNEIELNNLFLTILKSVTRGTVNSLIDQLELTSAESFPFYLNRESYTRFSLESELFIDGLVNLRRDEKEPNYLRRLRRSINDYQLTEEYYLYQSDLQSSAQGQFFAYLHKPPTNIESWLQKNLDYIYSLGEEKVKQAKVDKVSSRGPIKLRTWKKKDISKKLHEKRLREIRDGQSTTKSSTLWSERTIQNAMTNVPLIEDNRKLINKIISSF